MREFNHSQSYHDNEGNLLHGRIKFFKKDTTEYEEIYDDKGTVISNPIYTNNIGQTSQNVFLADKDYTVQFEKYIGDGIMEDEYEDTDYVFQYSCIDLYDTFNIDVTTKGIQVIETITDLRNTNPSVIEEENGIKLIALAGYNKAGDKPLIHYVWNETSTSSDNGGSVIKYNDLTTGRWVFVKNQDTKIDVRHFGAFPLLSAYDVSETQSYAIQNAYNYATSTNKNIYFPNNESGAGYYRIISSLQNVIVDKNTYFMIPNDLEVDIKLIEDSMNFNICQTPDYKGNVNLYGKELHYNIIQTIGTEVIKEYHKINFNPSEKFTVDYNHTSSLDFTGIKVVFEQNLTSGRGVSISLNNCEIISDKAISDDLNLSLTDCFVKQSYFDENCTFRFIDFTRCSTDIDYWTDMNLYQDYLLKNGDKTVDFKNKVISGTFEFNQDMNLSNIGGGKIKLGQGVNELNIMNSAVIIDNESTNVKINLTNVKAFLDKSFVNYLKIIDSYVVSNTDTNEFNILEVHNGTINVKNAVVNQILSAEDSVLIGESFTTNENLMPNLMSCTVDIVFFSKTIDVENCLIQKDIVTSDVNGLINFIIKNNKFVGGVHRVYSDTPDTKVIGQWVCNSGTDVYIYLDRTNLDPVEKNHSYTYENNVGMPSQSPHWQDDLYYVEDKYYTNFEDHNQFSTFIPWSGPNTYSNDAYLWGSSRMKIEGDGTTDPAIYTTQFTMFTVGTDLTGTVFSLKSGMIPVIEHFTGVLYFLRLEPFEFICSNEEEPVQGSTGLAKNIMWSDGYNWRLYDIPLCYLNASTRCQIDVFANYGHDRFTFTFEGKLLK